MCEIDIKVIDKANSKGYLSGLKHLLIGNSKHSNKESSNVSGSKGYPSGLKHLLIGYSKHSNKESSNVSGYVKTLLSHSWMKLEELNLDSCNLTEEDVEAIGKANDQGYLPCMKILSLNRNVNISGSLRKLVSGSFSELTDLALYECNLTEDDVSAIHEANGKGFLPSIDLTVKSLSSSGHIPVVPVMCGAWREQEVLDVRECEFSKQDVTTIAEASRHSRLPSVKEINLSKNKNTSGHIDSLLSSNWQSLQKLNMWDCNLTVEDIRVLGEANRKGYLPSLQEVNLSFNRTLSGQLALLLNHTWPALQVLYLQYCNLTVEDIRALGEANRKGYLPSIHEVDLSENKALSGQLALLFTHTWPVLQKLNLQYCYPTVEDIRALVEANRKGYLPFLQMLDLTGNLDTTVIPDLTGILGLTGNNKALSYKALFTLPWPVLQKLKLKACNLTVEDIRALGEANRKGYLPSVHALDMSDNTRLYGQLTLLLTHTWPVLQELHLGSCDLTVKDIRALGEANRKGYLPSLQEVKGLYGNKNVPGQVAMLLSSAWQSLQELHLQRCNLTVEDIEALGEAIKKGYLPSLQKVDLSFNKALSGQLTLLFTHTWPVLQELLLEGCKLTVEDIRALGEANKKGYFPALQILNLAGNEALSGQLTLLFTHSWPVLQKLELQYCNLTVEDIRALVEANRKGYLPSVQILYLSANKALSCELALLFTHTWPVLQELNLYDCGLTPADGDALLDAYRQGRLPQLKKLNIQRHLDIPYDKISKLKEHIEEVKH